MILGTQKKRLLGYVLSALLTPLLFETCAAKRIEPPRNCDRVAIDSVKTDVGIWHDKIVRFSRVRGLTGPIIYVEIVPPAQSGSTNKIRRMILWWGAQPTAGAVCRSGPDIGQKAARNCSVGIPGTYLQLDVTFEPANTSGVEMRTKDLAKYISNDVFCDLK